MSENDIVRARRLPDGTVVQVFPDGSTRPIEEPHRLGAPGGDDGRGDRGQRPLRPRQSAADRRRAGAHASRAPSPPIRERLKLTQEAFAERFEIPLGTLRDWEQGVCYPDMAARTLLRVIEQGPRSRRQCAGPDLSPASPNRAR